MYLIKQIDKKYPDKFDGNWEVYFNIPIYNRTTYRWNSNPKSVELLPEDKFIINTLPAIVKDYKIGECECINNIIYGNNLPDFIKNKNNLKIKLYKYKINNTPYDTASYIRGGFVNSTDIVFNKPSYSHLGNFNFTGIQNKNDNLNYSWDTEPLYTNIDKTNLNRTLYKINEDLSEEELSLLSIAYYYEIFWFDTLIADGYFSGGTCHVYNLEYLHQMTNISPIHYIKDGFYVIIYIDFKHNISDKNPYHEFNNQFINCGENQYSIFYPLKKVKITTNKNGTHILHQTPYGFNSTEVKNVSYFTFVDANQYQAIDKYDGYGFYYKYPNNTFTKTLSYRKDRKERNSQFLFYDYHTIDFSINTGIWNGIDYNLHYYSNLNNGDDFNWFKTQSLIAYKINPITGIYELYDTAIYEPLESY